MRWDQLTLVALLAVAGHVESIPAEDIEGVQEHGLVSRYPGQEIRWQQIESYRPFRVPVGPVSGYRRIDDWVETQGLVTRTFYRYEGTDRSYSEFYLNYMEALKSQSFDILAEGISGDRRGADIGSRSWSEVYFINNPTTKPGEVGTLFAGTSSSGGAGTIVARKERAEGTVYAVISVEQHSEDYVGTLIDIIEVGAAETGLVVIDPDAIGAGIKEYGRVVLDGLVFDFDKATLQPASDEALSAIAQFLQENENMQFYVVGHTDSVGRYPYNAKLSADRAATVVDELRTRFGIAANRLEPHGVGPLAPVFSNSEEAGQRKNRRVELVER